MKKVSLILLVILFLTYACSKEEIKSILNVNIGKADSNEAFSANILMNNNVKYWKTTSANINQSKALGGIDYFAVRGGLNKNELTLMSFGKFVDDTSANLGRLTIFINNVIDTGIYELGGISNNYGIISIDDNGILEHYRTNQYKQGLVYISTYDTLNNKISGSFDFNASDNAKEISINNGSFFDVPFKQ
jgi:hypothetical protein